MVVEQSLRSYLVASAVGVGLTLVSMGTAGCAGRMQQPVAPSGDVRDSVALLDSQPRMLLAGPARLLHVQVDKRKGHVTLFRAPRQHGTSADCGAVPEPRQIVLAARPTSLDIGAGEVVCAKVERRARVSWHATANRAATKSNFVEPPGTLHQASLLP